MPAVTLAALSRVESWRPSTQEITQRGGASPETVKRAVADASRMGFGRKPTAMPLQRMLAAAYELGLTSQPGRAETRYGLMQRVATPEVLCPQLSDFEPKQIGGSIGAT